LEKAIEGGVVGIKIGVAYLRSLKFEKATRADAERVFNRIFGFPYPRHDWDDWEALAGPAGDEAKPLQDFVLHHVLHRASDRGLPVQIHTGFQEGNGNVITNSAPTLLHNLFFEYKNVKFDVFHGSYPYCSELATLAKNFPNVYADLCWLHVVSPAVARRALEEYIETVPGNKIFAFGGDYIFVEGAYAHSRMARQVVAKLLADKVEEGYFSEEEAVSLAQKMLRDNPYQLFCAGAKSGKGAKA
jgi:predicted TIM-barrel fold metal-dependent hydrolase